MRVPVRTNLLPDRFFAELDGRHLMVAGIDWSLEVYGICEQHGRRWIQLALTGQGDSCMLTLRVADRDDAGDVLETVSSWIANPADAPQVLSVA